MLTTFQVKATLITATGIYWRYMCYVAMHMVKKRSIYSLITLINFTKYRFFMYLYKIGQ